MAGINITGKSSCGVVWEDELETIIKMLSSGKRMNDLMEKYCCSESTIRKILDTNGISYSSYLRVKKPSKKSIQKTFEEGKTLFQASKYFGIPINSFSRIVVEYNLTPKAENKYKPNQGFDPKENLTLVPYGYFDNSIRSLQRIRVCRKTNSSKFDYYYFIPEIGRYVVDCLLVKTVLDLGINFREWECRWILGIDKSLLYSDEWAEKYISVYYPNLMHAGAIKEVKRRLIKGNFEIDFSLTKEDFKNDYIKSRKENNKAIFNYDFSLVPRTIKNVAQKVPLIVRETNSKTGKPFDEIWYTSYSVFISRLKDYRPLYYKRSKEETREERVRSFLKRAQLSHPGEDFDYTITEESYIDTKHKVKIKCNKCGEIFEVRPLDFVDHTKPCGCPNCSASSGEQFIESWCRKNNIEFTPRKTIYEEIFGRNTSRVVIDVIIENYMGRQVWIEYNGRQHYQWIPFFHKERGDFEKQLTRDQNVREYCSKNDILFIEIPYSFGTMDKIYDFLDRVLIFGEIPSSIVNYESLYKL